MMPLTRVIPKRTLAVAAARSIMGPRVSELEIKKSDRLAAIPPKENLVFGETFSDHMLTCRHREGAWQAPQIVPYQNLSLSPAASCLHYAIQCFEGMKAYVAEDRTIRLFRPDLNMARLSRSVERLALPAFDRDEFLECIKELVRIDSHWIPEGRGYSLYIRPTAIANGVSLGVGASKEALLFTILSPVGPYYKEGFKPVTLLADTVNVRAWPGGAGDTKIGGNYGPTILPQVHAANAGASQVLWLFGPNEEVTEVGTMNLFALWKTKSGETELVTAPLDQGTILPGVTRQSVLDLTREWGYTVSERVFTMPEVRDAIVEGRMIEMFGSGTAATISPIRAIKYNGENLNIPLALTVSGELTKRLTDELFDIQYGAKEHEWS
eukprot:UC4_evm1s958